MEEIQHIAIDLYRGAHDTRQGLQFDVAAVASRLKEEFPGIWFEEEYYHGYIELIKASCSGSGPEERMLKIFQRDASELGPKFAFTVSEHGVVMMKGCIARYRLSFTRLGHTPARLWYRAEEFLRSFCLTRSDGAPD